MIFISPPLVLPLPLISLAIKFKETVVDVPVTSIKLEVVPNVVILFQVPGWFAAAPKALLLDGSLLPKSILKEAAWAEVLNKPTVIADKKAGSRVFRLAPAINKLCFTPPENW